MAIRQGEFVCVCATNAGGAADRDAYQHVLALATVGASIHPYCAANRARNRTGELEPCEPSVAHFSHHRGERGTTASDHSSLGHLDRSEGSVEA